MSTIHLGRGSVVVEKPDDRLMQGLSLFCHGSDGDGAYEPLYTLSGSRDLLVTLPGFAERCRELCSSSRVIDERRPLPDPDLDAACAPLEPVWRGPVAKAIMSGGGILSVPDMLGSARVVASILRAFPRNRLVARGTPLSIIATSGADSARSLGYALRRLLPRREIGINHSDSDDVIVSSYSVLDDLPRHLAGVFIGDDVCEDTPSRAESVSAVRDAARWGLAVSPFGGPIRVDVRTEGLFGRLVSSVSYADAVRCGFGAPVTVCWIPAPRPNVQPGSAPFEILSAHAMQENPAFVRMVSDLVLQPSGDAGCIVHVDTVAMANRILARSDGLFCISPRTRKSERDALLENLNDGTIRRAVVVKGVPVRNPSHDVVIMATCGGGESVGSLIPWRPASLCTHAYMVDFSHSWDVHNGRPGKLALNDDSRRKKYRDLGFRQVALSDPSELPFVGG